MVRLGVEQVFRIKHTCFRFQMDVGLKMHGYCVRGCARVTVAPIINHFHYIHTQKALVRISFGMQPANPSNVKSNFKWLYTSGAGCSSDSTWSFIIIWSRVQGSFSQIGTDKKKTGISCLKRHSFISGSGSCSVLVCYSLICVGSYS